MNLRYRYSTRPSCKTTSTWTWWTGPRRTCSAWGWGAASTCGAPAPARYVHKLCHVVSSCDVPTAKRFVAFRTPVRRCAIPLSYKNQVFTVTSACGCLLLEIDVPKYPAKRLSVPVRHCAAPISSKKVGRRRMTKGLQAFTSTSGCGRQLLEIDLPKWLAKQFSAPVCRCAIPGIFKL